jgi:hypothetical protein
MNQEQEAKFNRCLILCQSEQAEQRFAGLFLIPALLPNAPELLSSPSCALYAEQLFDAISHDKFLPSLLLTEHRQLALHMYSMFVAHEMIVAKSTFTFALPYLCELFEERRSRLTWEEVGILVHILRRVLQSSSTIAQESLLRCFVYGTTTHNHALSGLWLFFHHHAAELQSLFQQPPSQLHQSLDSLLDFICFLFNYPHPKFRPLIHERLRMAFTLAETSSAVLHTLTLLCELFYSSLPSSPSVATSTREVYWALKVRLLYTLLALFAGLEDVQFKVLPSVICDHMRSGLCAFLSNAHLDLEQRDACFGVCHAFVVALGWQWTVTSPTTETQSLSNRYQFTELLLRLVNVELEVLFASQLRKVQCLSSSGPTENTSNRQAAAESLPPSLRAESDPHRVKYRLSVCSDLLEHAVIFLSHAADAFDEESPTTCDVAQSSSLAVEQYRQIPPQTLQRLYTIVHDTIALVLRFLQELRDNKTSTSDPDVIDAVVRMISVWLAEESEVMREQILDILPFILARALQQSESVELSTVSRDTPPLLITLLLPGVHRLVTAGSVDGISLDSNALRVIDILLCESDAVGVTFPLLLRCLRIFTLSALSTATTGASSDTLLSNSASTFSSDIYQTLPFQLLLQLLTLLVAHLSRLPAHKRDSVISLLLQHLHLFDFHFQRCSGDTTKYNAEEVYVSIRMVYVMSVVLSHAEPAIVREVFQTKTETSDLGTPNIVTSSSNATRTLQSLCTRMVLYLSRVPSFVHSPDWDAVCPLWTRAILGTVPAHIYVRVMHSGAHMRSFFRICTQRLLGRVLKCRSCRLPFSTENLHALFDHFCRHLKRVVLVNVLHNL